jgi:tetratricopeptide (TPR) repeat protein
MAKGDFDEAKKAMAMIPDGPFESATYIFLVGRAYYELGEIDKAAPLIEEAVRTEPTHADAQYYLGLVRDEKGDARGATEAFLRARALDLSRATASWAPTAEAFATIVRGIVEKLDVVLGRYVREAEVYVVDVPGAELVVDGVDPRSLLILDAPELPNGTTRARIFVYQRNVERAAGSVDAMEEELRAAVEREITSVFLEKEPTAPTDKHQLN